MNPPPADFIMAHDLLSMKRTRSEKVYWIADMLITRATVHIFITPNFMEEIHMDQRKEVKMDMIWDVFKRKVKRRNKKICWLVGIVLLSMFAFTPVSAFQVYQGDDTRILWDTTVKYSAGFRLSDQSRRLTSNPNEDDGNRNFDSGLISNRFDVLSELDMIYKNVGVRISGAGWYDFEYNKDNDNDSPFTNNSISVPFDEFTDNTEALHGKDAEVLDAFVFAKGHLGNMRVSARVGQHTVLWGESLFLAFNGISYGQAPLDAVKLLSVPGTVAKELFRPVPQASVLLQLLPNLSLAGYYQYGWEKSRLPGAGSYFSDADLLGSGSESLYVPFGPPGTRFLRTSDMEADDSGQWGVALKYRPDIIDWEFGLYYLTFHEKTPQVYLYPAVGRYQLVYPENIDLLGVSFTTQLGDVSLGGEVHKRFDMPLMSSPQLVFPGMNADNDSNNLYATGDTVHASLSVIYLMKRNMFWQGGQFMGEAGYHRYSNVDNKNALDPSRSNNCYGFRMVFEPKYFQVLPGIDLTLLTGLGYAPKGNSSIAAKGFGGADEGGDFSIGLGIDYLQEWRTGIKYTNYFGDIEDRQLLADRDFISIWIQYTF
jgi:hypothetical protein